MNRRAAMAFVLVLSSAGCRHAREARTIREERSRFGAIPRGRAGLLSGRVGWTRAFLLTHARLRPESRGGASVRWAVGG